MMEVEKSYFEGTSSTKSRFVIPWLLNWESAGYAQNSYYLGEFTIAQGPPPIMKSQPNLIIPLQKKIPSCNQGDKLQGVLKT